MKTFKSVFVSVAVIGIVILPARVAQGAIAGSKHDFTASGGYPIAGVTEICVTCHVPHQTKMNVPLWAHAMSTYSYTLYNQNASYISGNTAAYDASPAALTGSMSRACLGCHDGTVAVSGTNYITQASAVWMLYDGGVKVGGQGSANPSSGLKGSHPIGITYNSATLLPAAEFKDIAADPDVKLESSKVQCVSCHNAHNKFPNMLVKSNAASALCLSCHVK